MPLYYIEMGQGVVVPTPAGQDLRIGTSPLSSCVLIAGYNANTHHAGAFHYPAKDLNKPDVVQDMSGWLEQLQPTQVKLVAAASHGFFASGTDPADLERLKGWLSANGHPSSEEKFESNGAMHVLQGTHFDVGKPNDLGGDFNKEDSDVDVSDQAAGDYAGYVLFGRDRNE